MRRPSDRRTKSSDSEMLASDPRKLPASWRAKSSSRVVVDSCQRKQSVPCQKRRLARPRSAGGHAGMEPSASFDSDYRRVRQNRELLRQAKQTAERRTVTRFPAAGVGVTVRRFSR